MQLRHYLAALANACFLFTTTIAVANQKLASGYTYCTGPSMTGNCQFASSQASDFDRCHPFYGYGSLLVYSKVVCILFSDDKCRYQSSGLAGELPGDLYWADLHKWPNGSVTAFRSFSCGTEV